MADKESNGELDNGSVEVPGKGTAAQPEAGAQVPKREYDELKEQMLRIAAEFDNYKKRTKGDVENARNVGKAEAVKGMLPILDEFELAMLSMAKADPALAKGVEMIFSNMVDALRALGMKEVKADGMYDPYVHEPILAMKSEKKPGTILQVTKKGYMLNDLLIRPASVIIAGLGKEDSNTDKKGEKEAEEAADNSKNAKN